MKILHTMSVLALLAGITAGVSANAQNSHTLVVTASNTSTNNLLVYNTSNQLIQTVATGGSGGVSGNSGGIATWRDQLAVVNYGSQNVSIFGLFGNQLRLRQIIPAESSPLSVAFGHDHLYILSSTKIESHPIFSYGMGTSPDGSAELVKADGSAAQVGVLDNQLIISEKSGAIETVNLNSNGAVNGVTTLVQNIPANVNAPFGLVTRDNEAYVTIAHANEISLVRDDDVLTTTGSGTQSAPCWLALDGPFLYSSNSPSQSVSRYVVYGQHIVQDAAVVASFTGDPTDIAHRDGLVAVIDGNNGVSQLSIFSVDVDGNLTLNGVSSISSAANGVVIINTEN
jgi:hypothetical protein